MLRHLRERLAEHTGVAPWLRFTETEAPAVHAALQALMRGFWRRRLPAMAAITMAVVLAAKLPESAARDVVMWGLIGAFGLAAFWPGGFWRVGVEGWRASRGAAQHAGRLRGIAVLGVVGAAACVTGLLILGWLELVVLGILKLR